MMSMQAALDQMEAGGPLSLLEGVRIGGPRANPQVKSANKWLSSCLTPDEREMLARLSLFRYKTSSE